MSIESALAQMDPATRGYAIVGGIAVLATLLAGFVGVHHGGRVLGPPRLMDEDRLGSLWLTAVIGFYSLYVPGSIYFLSQPGPTTGPATAPVTLMDLSPRVSAMLAMAQPLTVLAAVVITATLAWPQWPKRLGLRLYNLPRGLVVGLVAILVVLPVMFVVAQLTQLLWEYVGLEHPKAHALLRAMSVGRDPLVQWLITCSAILLAPVAEELLFRGFLQTAILYALNRRGPTASTRWAAIFITSCVFMLYHPELWMMPPIFVLSMCLGYLYERTGILWACMLLHAGFNAANVLLFRLQNGSP